MSDTVVDLEVGSFHDLNFETDSGTDMSVGIWLKIVQISKIRVIKYV